MPFPLSDLRAVTVSAVQRPSGHKMQAWRITKDQSHYHPSTELQQLTSWSLIRREKRKAYLFNALLPDVKHSWFDSTESGLADRPLSPRGWLCQVRRSCGWEHTQQEHKDSVSLLMSWKAVTQCKSRSLLVPGFNFHYPSAFSAWLSKSTFNDLRPCFPEEFHGCFGWL